MEGHPRLSTLKITRGGITDYTPNALYTTLPTLATSCNDSQVERTVREGTGCISYTNS